MSAILFYYYFYFLFPCFFLFPCLSIYFFLSFYRFLFWNICSIFKCISFITCLVVALDIVLYNLLKFTGIIIFPVQISLENSSPLPFVCNIIYLYKLCLHLFRTKSNSIIIFASVVKHNFEDSTEGKSIVFILIVAYCVVLSFLIFQDSFFDYFFI